jgi:hypothetical protein
MKRVFNCQIDRQTVFSFQESPRVPALNYIRTPNWLDLVELHMEPSGFIKVDEIRYKWKKTR